eukprot:scaffold310615_cov33-Tisochrysis_lutea.AAC.1
MPLIRQPISDPARREASRNMRTLILHPLAVTPAIKGGVRVRRPTRIRRDVITCDATILSYLICRRAKEDLRHRLGLWLVLALQREIRLTACGLVHHRSQEGLVRVQAAYSCYMATVRAATILTHAQKAAARWQ